MPTIKELYDAGQRQFPMRGGGISPALFIYGHTIQAQKDEAQEGRMFQCLAWGFDGLNCDGFHALDLLPDPLPNQSERIATLEAALTEAAGYVDLMNGDEGDRFRAIAGGQDNEHEAD